VASSDEENKRRYLANLAAMGTDLAFESEMASNPEIMRDIAPNEYLRSIDQAAAFDDMSQNSLQRARALANTQVQQEPIQNNFFTQRGDNKALNLLRGIVGNRLISRGLLEDPTDIAKRNLYARQARTAQIANLGDEAQNIQDLANQTRAQAFARAQQAGVNVDPRLALSAKEQVTNAITTQGLDFNPSDALTYSQDSDNEIRFQYQRQLLPGLVASGTITEAQKSVFENQDAETLNNSLMSLRVPAQDGGALPGDTINPLTGETFFSANYSNEARSEMRLFGEELTAPERRANKSYGDIHEEYRRSGRFIDGQNIADLSKVVGNLTEAVDEKSKAFTGPIAGKIPDALKAFYGQGQKALDTRAALRNVVQKTFREILGGQFAFLEGERLIQNAYDENLPPEYNLIRVRRLLFQATEIAKAGAERAAHFDTYGTLYGANEKQLDSGLDGLIASVSDETIAERGLYSLFSGEERELMFNALLMEGSPKSLKELQEIKDWEAENIQ
jgi:hypothetical protein